MDSDYFRQRAEAERHLARNAAGDEARAVHSELARRYDRLLEGAGTAN